MGKLITALLLVALMATTAEATQMSGTGAAGTTDFDDTAPSNLVTDYTGSCNMVWFRFESGSELVNSADSGGTLLSNVGTPAYTTTDFTDGAQAFSATDPGADYPQCLLTGTTCDAIEFTGAFTIMADFKETTAGQNDHVISTGAQGTADGYTMRVGSGNRVNCWIGDGTSNVQANLGVFDQSGNWTNMVCTHDGTNTLTARRSVTADSITASVGVPIMTAANDIEIGANGTGGGLAAGPIDNVIFMDCELTVGQICQLCACGPEGDTTKTGWCTCSDATSYSDDGRISQTCVSSQCSVDGGDCVNNGDCITCNGCTPQACAATAP